MYTLAGSGAQSASVRVLGEADASGVATADQCLTSRSLDVDDERLQLAVVQFKRVLGCRAYNLISKISKCRGIKRHPKRRKMRHGNPWVRNIRKLGELNLPFCVKGHLTY